MVGHEGLEPHSPLPWLACNEFSDFIEKGDKARLIRGAIEVIKKEPVNKRRIMADNFTEITL
jgi:hypothetical protein